MPTTVLSGVSPIPTSAPDAEARGALPPSPVFRFYLVAKEMINMIVNVNLWSVVGVVASATSGFNGRRAYYVTERRVNALSHSPAGPPALSCCACRPRPTLAICAAATVWTVPRCNGWPRLCRQTAAALACGRGASGVARANRCSTCWARNRSPSCPRHCCVDDRCSFRARKRNFG